MITYPTGKSKKILHKNHNIGNISVFYIIFDSVLSILTNRQRPVAKAMERCIYLNVVSQDLALFPHAGEEIDHTGDGTAVGCQTVAQDEAVEAPIKHNAK